MVRVLQDSNYAAKFWSVGPDKGNFDRVPRHKFQFFVNFILEQPVQFLPYIDSSLSDPESGVSFKVKNFERPGVQITTDSLNQYNKKRVVQNKLEFEPVTVRFWDTVDDRVLKLWAQYYRFYFGEGRKVAPESWSYDVAKGAFNNDIGGWGFNPPKGSPSATEFFSTIDLYHVWGGNYNLIRLVRPKIVQFNHDTDDYEDSSNGQEITLQLQHEGIIYDAFHEPITADIANLLGLNRSDYYPLPEASNNLPPTPGLKPNFDAEGNFLSEATSSVARGAGNIVPVPDFIKQEAAQNRRSSGLGSFGSFDFGGVVSDVVEGTASGTFENLAEGVLSGEGVNFGTSVSNAVSGAVSNSGLSSSVFNSISSGMQARGASPQLARRLAGTLGGAVSIGANSGVRGRKFNLGEALRLDSRDVIDLTSQAVGEINRARPPSAPQGQRRPTRTSQRVAVGDQDPGFFDQMGAELGDLGGAIDDLFTSDPKPVPGTLP